MNLSNLDYSKIYRIYKDGDDIVIWFVNDERIRYQDLSEEERNNLCESTITEAKKKGYALEVHDGLYEAKNYRFYGAKGH